MAKINSKLVQMAATMTNPIAFTSTTGQAIGPALATMNADLQLLIDAISYEETDPTFHRLFLDEMSPQCRTSLYKMLTSMKALIIA